jgi:hypothetical protein
MFHTGDELLNQLDLVEALAALKIVLLESGAVLGRKLTPYVGLHHSAFLDLFVLQHWE